VTGTPQWRPAAGWLRRRLVEFASDAGTTLAGDRGAVPPRRLRSRVGAPGVTEYLEGGRAAALELEAALAPQHLGDFASVLDFGCGPGRVLSHVRALVPDARRLVGVDVDPEAIAWAQAHSRRLTFAPSNARPPLPFGDAEFSLVYSISVLSHLDEAAQDAWLAELARVLVPGGVALLSIHGVSAHEAFRSGAVQTAWCDPRVFAASGPLGAGEIRAVPYRRSRWSRGDLPGVGEGYGLAFHGERYIREHWSRFLDVSAILPRAISGWQDLVVAHRPG
jgi:SAM-dependent methyltransferase